MKQIFLVCYISMATVLMADYTRANGVVLDNSTSLEWQDDYSDNAGVVKQATWENAIVYCNTLSLAGHNDWRLPNIIELKSIIDYTQSNPSVFMNTANSRYWSSTSRADRTSYAWGMRFGTGDQYRNAKSYSSYVRCVRAGQ